MPTKGTSRARAAAATALRRSNLLERVVDTADAVLFRGEKKTARQLRLTRARVE